MEFLVTDGETFVHEEKRDLKTSFEYIDPEALGVRYVNRDPDGRYSLTKEMICDPHHGVVLQRVRLEGREDLVPRLKLYALLAPHLDGGGAGNSARAMDLAGHKVLLAWKNEWSLAMTASCGFTRMSCGFVGASDGWQDLMQNFKMDWEFGSATNGNIAVMGEIDLGCSERAGERAGRSRRRGRDGEGHRRKGGAGVHAGDRDWRRAPYGGAKDDGLAVDAVRGAAKSGSSSSGSGRRIRRRWRRRRRTAAS